MVPFSSSQAIVGSILEIGLYTGIGYCILLQRRKKQTGRNQKINSG
jgi:phosphate/sulfate permease